eukprot:3799042-Pleurochrysis_carterae.AAC.1
MERWETCSTISITTGKRKSRLRKRGTLTNGASTEVQEAIARGLCAASAVYDAQASAGAGVRGGAGKRDGLPGGGLAGGSLARGGLGGL